MQKKYIIRLSSQERQELMKITRTGKHAAYKLMHAKVILAADVGEDVSTQKTDKEVAISLGIGMRTVERIRQRCVEEGIESALNRKPCLQKKALKMSGEEEAHLVAICCSQPPEGRTRWTLKLLSNRLVELKIVDSISPATVGRALKKTNLNHGKKKNGASPLK